MCIKKWSRRKGMHKMYCKYKDEQERKNKCTVFMKSYIQWDKFRVGVCTTNLKMCCKINFERVRKKSKCTI